MTNSYKHATSRQALTDDECRYLDEHTGHGEGKLTVKEAMIEINKTMSSTRKPWALRTFQSARATAILNQRLKKINGAPGVQTLRGHYKITEEQRIEALRNQQHLCRTPGCSNHSVGRHCEPCSTQILAAKAAAKGQLSLRVFA